MKFNYKFKFIFVIILASKFKQFIKIIYNLLNWKSLKSLIENYIKNEFRFLYIDYIVIYFKTFWCVNNFEMNNYNDENNENALIKKQAYDNIYFI